MGKKGDLLRAQKKQAAVYTFTAEQLAEHDKMILRENRERVRETLKPEAEKYVQGQLDAAREIIRQEWETREKEFYTDSADDNFFNLLQYMLCVTSRVLIEKFRWKPIPKDGKYDRRNRTMRFADCVADEIARICSDECADIRKYAEETYQLYGVKYKA